MEQTSKKKTPSLFRKITKVILWVFFHLIILVVVALIGVNFYLATNKTKVLENLPFLNNGSVTFDETSISIFKDFPSATLSIKNITVQDSMIEQHHKPLLQLGKLSAALTIGKLFQDSIEINAIELHHGEINIFTDVNDYNNLNSLFKTKEKKDSGSSDKKEKMQLLFDGLEVLLSDVRVHFTNAIKTSSIHGHVEQLKTRISKTEDDLGASIDMIINVEELAFKKRKGSFVANSRIAGKLNVAYKDGAITIDPFDLKINDELFKFSGDIQPGKISSLTLVNPKTSYQNTLSLLPEGLQSKISPYQVSGLFYTKTIIQGSFKPGDEPIIDIQFNLDNNDVKALNNDFRQVKLDGRFVNRIYTDDRKWTEGKQRIRFEINNLEAKHDDFKVVTKNALLTSTKPEGLKIRINANVQGEASGISKWFKNDQFFFEKGRFDLTANLSGSIKSFNELLIASDATLDLQDFAVWYKPGNVSFPFKELKLKKDAGDAKFSIINSTFVDGHNIHLDGGLKNLPALIFDLSDEQANSEVHIVSSKLGWEDFVNLFGENGYLKNDNPKTETEKKKSMKETISGVYYNFQPRLSMSIGSLTYYDIIKLEQFQTGVHFKDEHTLVLEKTSFEYDKGLVDFSAQMDISNPHQTPFEFELHTENLNLQELLPALNFLNVKLLADMEYHADDVTIDIRHKGILNDQNGLIPNSSSGEISFSSETSKDIRGKISYQPNSDHTALIMHLEMEGGPVLFNDFFKTEQFFFSEGRFFVELDYTGDITSREDLFYNSTATFSMSDAYIYYKPVNVNFPFKRVDLDLHQDNANFSFLIRSDAIDREINFAGTIENLSEMVIGNTGKSFKVDANVSSPKLAWKNFLDIFAPEKEAPSDQPKEKNVDKMKATVKSILTKFNPTIKVNIDTFIYSNQLTLNKLQAGIHLKDSALLVVDQTGFDFYDGSMSANGELDLGKKDHAPFKANFQSDDLDIVRLLKSLDYLNLPSLQSIEKLSGRITMNLDIEGDIANDAKGLIPEATRGILDFELHDVALGGFPTLDTMATKIRMKKRFRELRFAPISNRITIIGEEFNIPLMEIQSNALNLFIEGKLSYTDNMNIWVSLPLKNLKRRNLSIIPKKLGYAATRRKVFLEVTSDETDANKFKFRFRKRKFYKHRGILSQYRKDKRKWRKMRQEKRKK